MLDIRNVTLTALALLSFSGLADAAHAQSVPEAARGVSVFAPQDTNPSTLRTIIYSSLGSAIGFQAGALAGGSHHAFMGPAGSIVGAAVFVTLESRADISWQGAIVGSVAGLAALAYMDDVGGLISYSLIQGTVATLFGSN
jgi:phage tail tape-measure protein